MRAKTKTQISLRILKISLKFSLSTWRNFAPFAIQSASSEVSDHTAQTLRLIWIFIGRKMPGGTFVFWRCGFDDKRVFWHFVTDKILKVFPLLLGVGIGSAIKIAFLSLKWSAYHIIQGYWLYYVFIVCIFCNHLKTIKLLLCLQHENMPI